MIHLRVIAPRELAERAERLFEGASEATNVVRSPAAGRQPAGDLVAADVSREAASLLIEDLRELDIDRVGSITAIPVELALSPAAESIRARAGRHRASPVVWEQVAERASDAIELRPEYLVFMGLAAVIAMVGLITDSIILLVGAMILGPEFGPLAGACVAIVLRQRSMAVRSLSALTVGLALAVAVSWGATELARLVGFAPDDPGVEVLTDFVSHPNRWSVIVALAAGVAGMLSLTTIKSGALVGVLVSVTTIPAAAMIGVAAAYGDWTQLEGATLQLLTNVGCLLLAGVGTLLVQRSLFRRRLEEHLLGPGRAAAGLAGDRAGGRDG